MNFGKLRNGSRLTKKGCHGEILTIFGGKRFSIHMYSTIVDRKHGTGVDGYACLRLHTLVSPLGFFLVITNNLYSSVYMCT
jgi:hypothetical protein